MYPCVLNIFAGLYFGDERKKTNKKTGVFDEEHFYFSYIPINKRKRGGKAYFTRLIIKSCFTGFEFGELGEDTVKIYC